MKCVGIIAEYNPFHNAHAYQIAEAKRLSGTECAVVVMSASFVQRGEPACLDKFTRARLAAYGGADLVIELPDVLSCSCAERFAYGGVRLLAASGLVDSIAFGSECGELDVIRRSANAEPDPEALRELLKEGYSYPKALSLCGAEEGISPALAANGLEAPNDLLAVQYVRQINRIAPQIQPIAIKRIGNGYNERALSSEFASASAIRAACERGDTETISSFLPEKVYNAIVEAKTLGRFPAAFSNLSSIVLYALRSMGAAGIGKIADVSEGLENPIFRSSLEASSTEELLDLVKTKRYTLARLRRILMNAVLGTTAELQDSAFRDPDGLYLRVLYAAPSSRGKLLSALSSKASLPVIIRGRDVQTLTGTAFEVYEHSKRAAALRSLACPVNLRSEDEFIRFPTAE